MPLTKISSTPELLTYCSEAGDRWLRVILFTVRTQLDPDIPLQPAPGFYPVYPHRCGPPKFPSLWTLSENSKDYQHLWNSEREKKSLFAEQNFNWTKHLGPESADRVPAVISHTFIFASTVKMEAVHTVLRPHYVLHHSTLAPRGYLLHEHCLLQLK